jgi:excinuclease ABC subunit A
VKRDTVDEIATTLLALGEGTRLQAMFPVQPAETQTAEDTTVGVMVTRKKPKTARGAKTGGSPEKSGAGISDVLRERLAAIRARGFNRLMQDGKLVEFSTPESLLELDFSRPVYALVDRVVVSAEARGRIVDAVEIAYREAGEVVFETVPRPADDERAATEPVRRLRFSHEFECKHCGMKSIEPEPRLFSFNNPFGACPRCQGFGNTIDFDMGLVIPNPNLSLDEGAIEPWTRPKYRAWQGELRKAAKLHKIPMSKAWADLSKDQQEIVLDGHGSFAGVNGFFKLLERKKYKLHVRVFLSRYRGYALCPDCRGQRLRAEARAVTLGGLNICEASALTVAGALEFFTALALTPMQAEIAGKVLEEIRARLGFLNQVGLEYLTLDRLASSLSGGESQRIQLATSLGSRLVGALYVLDEPSIGLHTRDTGRLIRILEELRDLGNTVLVVEHDADVIHAADRLLDLGPGAGELGGKLLASGTVAEVMANPASLTGRYLSGEISIPVPTQRRAPGKQMLRIVGARAHNIRNLNCEIPLGMMCCITGVSGSGKSTLVHEVLFKGLEHELGETTGPAPATYRQIIGTQYLSGVVLVDQSPIGRTPRSNPVTYIKAFDAIRDLFASQPESLKRGYSPGYFSFNVPGGRCEVCQGDGTVTVEMQFLADVELPCEECSGLRYKAPLLEVRYKGKNIHDVLDMTVREALHFFAGQTKIVDRLAVLDEVGLGYLRLGQSATTLSGGEAQRVKLASHLANARGGSRSAKDRKASRILYILDEPTTGLHFDDVGKLLTALRKLIQDGGSLLVIEHNLDVLKNADWIIDMGPEGGDKGGGIVATGTPEEIAAAAESYTGQALRKVLKRRASPVAAEVLVEESVG